MAMVEEKSRKSSPTRVDRDEETAFLNAIPWRLDAHLQSAEILRRTLHSEASRFEELPYQPTFSLVAVLRDPQPEHLHELILSCRCQSYRQWQLVLIDDASQSQAHLEIADFWSRKDCRILLERLSTPLGPSGAKNLAITKVTGDFLVVIDGDGVLHPMALGIFARQLSHNPAVNFIFANEAEIDARSETLSTFLQKPPLDLFTLLRINYVGRLFAVKRDMLERATQGEPAFRAEFDGIEEHDFLLRLALCDSTESQHVPLNVYYRRARSGWLARLTENELAEEAHETSQGTRPAGVPGCHVDGKGQWRSGPACQLEPLDHRPSSRRKTKAVGRDSFQGPGRDDNPVSRIHRAAGASARRACGPRQQPFDRARDPNSPERMDLSAADHKPLNCQLRLRVQFC